MTEEQIRVYAERYAWLREQSWFDGQLCVVRAPRKSLAGKLALGCDCPSLTRLDTFIDEARAGKDITQQVTETGMGILHGLIADLEGKVPCPHCGVDTRFYGCFCEKPNATD